MNWSRTKNAMRDGGLKAARDLYMDLGSFEEARWLAGKRLRINNIEVVARPGWVYTLFDGEHGDE